MLAIFYFLLGDSMASVSKNGVKLVAGRWYLGYCGEGEDLKLEPHICAIAPMGGDNLLSQPDRIAEPKTGFSAFRCILPSPNDFDYNFFASCEMTMDEVREWYVKNNRFNGTPKTEIIKERWACDNCDEAAPCIVEIQYSNKDMPEHLKGETRFRKQVCVCGESHLPDWRPISGAG